MNPKVSVVILTYNKLSVTKNCLESIDLKSNYSNLEVIVVDNNSTDETPKYLKTWAKPRYSWSPASSNKKIILNSENKGFAAGNNQGLKEATGDYIVILNNDTVVTYNWVEKFIRHFEEDEKLGLLAPMTNYTSAPYERLNLHYGNNILLLDEYFKNYLARNTRKRIYANYFPLFGVMITREVLNNVGLLDEDYGIGFFEDNDYCKRIENAGYRLACATDLYTHHEGSVSLNQRPDLTNLFNHGLSTYTKKWGEWSPKDYKVYQFDKQ